jgi:hypothetical protein
MQDGVSLRTISRATGISMVTLSAWRGKVAEPHFQKIVVADQSTTGAAAQGRKNSSRLVEVPKVRAW